MGTNNKKRDSEFWFCVVGCFAMSSLGANALYYMMNGSVKVSSFTIIMTILWIAFFAFAAIVLFRRTKAIDNSVSDTTEMGNEQLVHALGTIAPGRDYYRGVVVGFCWAMGRPILYVDDRMNDVKNWDPAKTLDLYKEEIESDIIIQSLQFCVDRFNRMQDNDDANDFERGEEHGYNVARIGGLDHFIMMYMQEDIALGLLKIDDSMNIESLSPREAYECALICNMATRKELFADKSKLSLVLLEYAAEKGDCYAMYQMAMIASGSNDYEKARSWFLKAAEKGMDIAQYAVGNIYYYGQGVEVDYSEAIRWYRLAAKQGQPQAQCNLGACYYYGQGVDVDYNEAFNWYFKSAESGEPNALYNLGTCYMNGQGTEKDMHKALDYFELAAEKGHSGAEAKVSLFAAMLKDKT